jgi:hypothetical protein
VLFAAIGGGLADLAPSGWEAGDIVFGALLAASISLAASRARRWTWLWAATLTFAAAGGEAVWVGVAALALLLAITAAVMERRARTWGALVGALCSVPLLHLPDHGDVQGASALIVVVAVAPLVVSGFRRSRTEERRRAVWAVLAVGCVGLVVCAAYGAAAFMARQHLERGVDQAEAGLELIRDGETEAAAAVLAQATTSFADAETLLTGPLSIPALGVPVVGHHARATAEMTRAGVDLTEAAVAATSTARYDAVAPDAGQVDLVRLTGLREPLEESQLALEDAEARLVDLDDEWLVPPVAEPLDRLRLEIDDALAEAELASAALEVAPGLLGAGSPKTYVVLLGQPAESRFGGGFVGTWAELRAEAGRVDLVESGTIEDLRNAPGFERRTLTGPDEYIERYGRYQPAVNLQNVTASPDFPTVRRVITELYPQTGRPPIDGALYVDPTGLAALLRLSGPVEVAGLPAPLDPDNAAEVLATEIYELYPEEADRDPVLRNAIDAVFDALTSRDLPGPRTVAVALGPAVRGNHLAFSVADPAGETFLGRIGATGSFPDVREGHDLIAVKTANAAPNKIDSYLQRAVRYDAEVDPATGAVSATARLTITNTAPATGLPRVVGINRGLIEGDPAALPAGTAITTVSVWSPFLATGATVDGEAVPLELQTELGHHVYSASLVIPTGATVSFELSLRGTVSLPYELVVDHQPLGADDSLTVGLSTPDGWSATALEGLEPVPEHHDRWRQRSRQAEDAIIRATFERSGG